MSVNHGLSDIPDTQIDDGTKSADSGRETRVSFVMKKAIYSDAGGDCE